jgi:PAS domain S-box-containing protein
MAPMIFTDLDDRVIAANDAFCKMIGFDREEVLGRDSKPFTYPEDVGITEDSHRRITDGQAHQSRYVKRYLRKDGRLIYVEVLRSPARDQDGNILYHVISERDITDERALAAQLSHQALHDTLTGLSNRALFDDRLEQARYKMTRDGGHCAVLFMAWHGDHAARRIARHLRHEHLKAGSSGITVWPHCSQTYQVGRCDIGLN